MHLIAKSPNYALKIRSRFGAKESSLLRLKSFKYSFSFTFIEKLMVKEFSTKS